MTAVRIRAAEARDLGAAARLLDSADLPTDDLTAERLALVAEVGESVVAAIGLEQFESLGLLRSLVVDPSQRGSGLGRQLVADLERHASAKGVEELWLLTIDADGFFERLGYSRRDRDSAPAEIAATEEFSDLCPASAVLMQKRLER